MSGAPKPLPQDCNYSCNINHKYSKALSPSTPIPVTAVFDIGKTNKKFFLFDEQYSIVQKKQTTLEQTEDDDGDACEDLMRLEYWVQNKLRDVLQNSRFDLQSLNFSGYGATLAHLDREGNTATPIYDYLKSYPKELLSQFYESYGGRKTFALETASPPMGMLNSGLQLYWLKHQKPHLFKKIACTLHFPQYLSYLITGEQVSEQTSIGCHTGLWNFEQNDYHRWVEEESIRPLLPEVKPLGHTFDTRYEGAAFSTGIGIHDSSAALAPYLFALDDPFMLVSTGTWSITLNPFNTEPLTFEELERDCLCYMDIHGKQVKASRLFLGNEYAHQIKKMSRHFGLGHRKATVAMDPELLRRCIAEASPARKLQLETAHNSGPFPQERPGNWQVEQFSSFKEAYHQLMLDLAAIQVEAIRLAEGSTAIDKLIITGGVSQNDFFVSLLASFLPNQQVYTASLSHASALGAAMVVNKVDEQEEPVDWTELLGLKRHHPHPDLELKEYAWKSAANSCT